MAFLVQSPLICNPEPQNLIQRIRQSALFARMSVLAEKISDFVFSKWGAVITMSALASACFGMVVGASSLIVSSLLILAIEACIKKRGDPQIDRIQGVRIGKTKVMIEIGSIVKTKGIDAIVNAANSACCGGAGVDGTIHEAAGPSLLVECQKLPQEADGSRCKTGSAVVTSPGNLTKNGVKWIIHAVGPRYNPFNPSESDEVLKLCYANALRVAFNHGVRAIGFPLISAGIYGYPLSAATQVAVAALEAAVKLHPDRFDEIRLIVPTANSDQVFQAWNDMLHQPHQEEFMNVRGRY